MAHAQQKEHAADSAKVISIKQSPRTATILSAVLPGAGQIYNHKYWKLPLIYGIMGSSAYLGIQFTQQVRDTRAAYHLKKDSQGSLIDPLPNYSTDQILNDLETYKKRRDMAFVACGAFYVLNIIDAAVDAHFFNFDVSDDLSLHLAPAIPIDYRGSLSPSIKLAFTF